MDSVESRQISDYVADHVQTQTEMYAKANSTTIKKAAKRKQRNDLNTSLRIGTTLFMKDHSAKGRHKLRTVMAQIYSGVGRPDPEGNVYVIESAKKKDRFMVRKELRDASQLENIQTERRPSNDEI